MAQRRGLLIYNPQASTTSPRTRDVIASALGEELKLDVVATRSRGHASELAAGAREDGIDVVVALGGDGTANEVADGLLQAGVGPEVPALAVVPGGCTNVFARTVGLPVAPIEATGQLLEALREGRRRRIGVGRADERVFLFAAGVGFDAEVVERVEAARAAGRRATGPLYARVAVAHCLLSGRRGRRPSLLVGVPGEPEQPAAVALVTNTDPWTYLLERPVRPTPQARYEAGLDVFALRRLRPLPTLRTVLSITGEDGAPRGRDVTVHHDLSALVVRSADGSPRAVQVDGDLLGRRAEVRFTAIPDALDVVA